MEIKEQVEKIHAAFDEYKKINDARLEEIKKNGTASAMTVEKLEKAEKHIQTLESKVEEMSKALARTGQEPHKEDKAAQNLEMKAKYTQAFNHSLKTGHPMPAELLSWAKKEMTVDDDTNGGFFVQAETSSEIVKKIYETSPMRQYASQQTISGGSFKILQDLDEAGAEWVGETQAGTNADTPEIKMIEIFMHEMRTKPRASQNLLEDAAVNLEAWLADKVAEKFSRSENTAFISGNGVNKPKGILAYASGTGFNQVERELTGANNAVTGDDFIDLQTLLKGAYDANARWFINRLMVGNIRKLKDSVTGAYIWQPSLQLGVPALLLGKPVDYAADLSSTVSANNELAIYGDFKQAYQIIDKPGIRVLRDPFTADPFVVFKTTKRTGGGVKNFEAVKVLKVTT